MEDGLVYNAMGGAKKLGISPDELGKKYDALKKGEGIIKFGGGFYCGKVDDIYVPHLMLSLFLGAGEVMLKYVKHPPDGCLPPQEV